MKLSTRMAVVKVLDFRRSSVSQKSPTHKSWGVNKSCELRYANFSKGSNNNGYNRYTFSVKQLPDSRGKFPKRNEYRPKRPDILK